MRTYLLIILACCLNLQAEPQPLKGELIYENSFREKIGTSWKSTKDKWQITDACLHGQEPEGNNHAVHLRFANNLEGDFTVELEMKLLADGAQAGVMFNATKGSGFKGHLGRATINEKMLNVKKDGVKSGEANKKFKWQQAVKGKWLPLTIEMKGDKLCAKFNGKELSATHEDFKKCKSKNLLLLAGKTVAYRNLKIFQKRKVLEK